VNLRGRIRQWMEAGSSVESVEAEILASARGLSEEDRAALWLYAWHLSDASGSRTKDVGGLVHTATGPRAQRSP
jgi:hypothetical protein